MSETASFAMTGESIQTDAELLVQCPKCLYLLEGLPVEHRCPGWNWTGDGASSAGEPCRPRRFARLRVLLAIPFLFVLWMFVGTAVGALTHPGFGRVWYVVAGQAVLPAFFGWLMFAKPTRFVAIGPKGIAIYVGRGRFRRWPWHHISKARYNLLRSSLDVHVEGRVVRISGFRYFRGNVFETDNCVRAINAQVRAHTDDAHEGVNAL